MRIEEFREIASKCGVVVSNPGARYAKMTFIGRDLSNYYSFSYCGVRFFIASNNDYVEVDEIPFKVLEDIYLETPEVFAGESPYGSRSDEEFEEDLKKIAGLDKNSLEYNKLYIEARGRLGMRPSENGVAKKFKIKTKEGLEAVINGLAKSTKSLDDWLKVYGGKLVDIKLPLRDKLSEFDLVVASVTTPSTKKVTVPESKNYIFSRSNENDFVCEVKYSVEEGKNIILTHYYSKNGLDDTRFKGEGIRIQVFEGSIMVAEIYCNFTDKLCSRFDPRLNDYVDSAIQPEDEAMVLELLSESTNYVYDASLVNKIGKGRK